MANKKKVERLINDAIENIEHDRSRADALLTEVTLLLLKDRDKHREVGFVTAKYLEVLQKSNEQLVKLIGMLKGKNEETVDLSDEEKAELFDKFQEEDAKEKKN